MDGDSAADGVVARIGSNSRDEGGRVAKIAQVVRHPSYSEETGQNDLALVKLAEKVPEKPVMLATGTDWGGVTLRLMGWGQTCPTKGCNTGSHLLMRVDVKVLPAAKCRAEGLEFNPEIELCLDASIKEGATVSSTACHGDAGGPAIRLSNGRLVGVISRGARHCGDQDLIVTRVQPHLDWIKKTTG